MALFGRKNSPVTPPPAPIEYKPEPAPAAKEELPELDFLKEPPVSEPAPTPAYQPAPAAFTPVNAEGVISKQPQYSQLVLETEKPPVITVCRSDAPTTNIPGPEKGNLLTQNTFTSAMPN